MNGNIEDLKKNLNETILTCVLMLGVLCWDYVINLLKSSGVKILMHETGAHPVVIGNFQIIVLVLIVLIHLARKADERRYV